MAAPIDLEIYKDALLVLGTAGVVVPVMHRFRISPVLGFLIAGAVLSPKGLGALSPILPAIDYVTITSPERVGKLAELGVVFLLFLIGLELSFERILTMRRLVFGLGAMQVLVSTVLIAFFAIGFGQPPVTAIVIGAALSLSSTAIVIEMMAQQKRLSSAAGRTSFAILLFQDLAVVPILFMLGVLDPSAEGSIAHGIAIALLQAAAALAIIVGVGRFLLRPLFQMVAQTGNHDLFIAATLFVAVGTSFATAAAGLSMALGAFVAGLMLAETEYRRAVQAAIEPVKSLLLGVFFFSVGLSLDLGTLIAHPLAIVNGTVGLFALQALIIFGLARLYGVSKAAAIETAAVLAPGGEFAFVVLTQALSYGLVSADLTSILLTSVALSMAAIPAVWKVGRQLAARYAPASAADPELSVLPVLDSQPKALVVGYGRVGQLIGDMLAEHKVPYIAADREPRIVSAARSEGKPVYYGDVRRLDFLNTCGLDTAKAAIITIHTQSEIDEIVTTLRKAHPKLIIVARAKDATHARHLYALGVTDAVPETIEASLQLSEAALVGIGVPTGLVIASVHQKRDDFRAELQGAAKAAGRETRAFPRRKDR
ncbi:MAG: cation:proton antiporter [Hyphomicrobium sp.]